MKILLLLMHFISASLVTALSACVLQTQMVLLALTNLGINITWSNRIYMVGEDIIGLLPSYGIVIMLGLAIGFGVAKAIRTYTRFTSYSLYIAAGGAAMICILVAMQPVLGVTLIAGARSGFGIVLQVVAGLLGGLVFMYLRKSHAAR